MAILTYEKFVAQQKNGMPPVVKGDLAGKTVMVTGANSGIGYEAAKHFATMNAARLIIVCRTTEKARQTIKSMLHLQSSHRVSFLPFLPLFLSSIALFVPLYVS